MTLQVRPAPALPRRTAPRGRPWSVLLAAIATALLRLPFVPAPLTSDEGGYLVVARAWHAGGTSLYGDHWVDRPPLLLLIYRLAAVLGGMTPLRVLGALGAALTVLLLGLAVRRAAGPRAGTSAAVVAGALLGSPLLGTVPVNGELLAAPFTAAGVWAATVALDVPDGPRLRRTALATGAAAAAAVLVKQNMADAGVYAVVLAAVAHRHGRHGRAWLRTVAAYLVAGSVAVAGAVLGVAAALGSRPGSVFFAMYPFRLRAASVMAAVPWTARWVRIAHLLELFGLSLGPVLLLGLAVVLARGGLERRLRAVAIATLAVAGYDAASILAGGSYWPHYLVELVVPVALAAGLLVTLRRTWVPVVLAATLVVAATAWVGGLHGTVGAAGQQVGRSLVPVSRPGDSVVSVLGEGGVVESSGLRAPYPYLWSLPSRTLDPRLADLDSVLEGPQAPTWVVVRGHGTWQYLDARGAGDVLRRHYHRAAVICHRGVWLRDGVARARPRKPGSCRLPLAP